MDIDKDYKPLLFGVGRSGYGGYKPLREILVDAYHDHRRRRAKENGDRPYFVDIDTDKKLLAEAEAVLGDREFVSFFIAVALDLYAKRQQIKVTRSKNKTVQKYEQRKAAEASKEADNEEDVVDGDE